MTKKKPQQREKCEDEMLKDLIPKVAKLGWVQNINGQPMMHLADVEKTVCAMFNEFEYERITEWAKTSTKAEKGLAICPKCNQSVGIGHCVMGCPPQASVPSKPLPCVCGHEKDCCLHGEIKDHDGVTCRCDGWVSNDQWTMDFHSYRPTIPLKDLRAMWEEAKKEAYGGEYVDDYDGSTKEIFERKLKEMTQ